MKNIQRRNQGGALKDNKVDTITKLTEEEKKEMVRDLLSGGKWFICNTEESLSSGAGLVLSCMDITDKACEDIGVVLGDLTKTVGSRACNGIPLFGAIKFIHKDDWSEVVSLYNEARAATEKVLSK